MKLHLVPLVNVKLFFARALNAVPTDPLVFAPLTGGHCTDEGDPNVGGGAPGHIHIPVGVCCVWRSVQHDDGELECLGVFTNLPNSYTDVHRLSRRNTLYSDLFTY